MNRLLMLLFLVPFHAFGATKKVEVQNGRVEFLAVGNPGFLKVKGKGLGVNGLFEYSSEEKKIKGVVSFKLDILETGISLRDQHMKEKYLEVTKFPEAKLEILDFDFIEPEGKAVDVSNRQFKGRLTLHGITQEISGSVTSKGDLDRQQSEANFKIHLPDYKIEVPKYAGVTVAEDVTVNIFFEPKIIQK